MKKQENTARIPPSQYDYVSSQQLIYQTMDMCPNPSTFLFPCRRYRSGLFESLNLLTPHAVAIKLMSQPLNSKVPRLWRWRWRWRPHYDTAPVFTLQICCSFESSRLTCPPDIAAEYCHAPVDSGEVWCWIQPMKFTRGCVLKA